MRIALTIIFISIAATSLAQDITGLWKGTLYNDTTQLYYPYEIGISEEKGKLSGFSHTWFIFEGKQYFGIKKVKISKKKGKIIIEDDGLIAHNYAEAPAKNVRQLNVLELMIEDSVMRLQGPFTTNRTKDYRALTGTVNLMRRNDYMQSALVPHLQELHKASELSFVKIELPEEPSIQIKRISGESEKISGEKQINQKSVSANMPVISSASLKNLSNKPAAMLNERKTEIQETIFFKSDSLLISLYDNGEVDGDTVTVVMNGNIFLEKQRLSTAAVQKKVYVDPDTDKIQLVMYAENLGLIPPNTGLMVVRDGKDIYEVRFSGDLNKNAAIEFRRKK